MNGLELDHFQNNILDRIAALEREIQELRGALGRFSSLLVLDGVDDPPVTPGYALLFVDRADGDLKVRFSDGTVKVISADT